MKKNQKKQDKQMKALMHRIEQKEKKIEQQKADEIKYKNQGSSWMGPTQNGPINRGGYFYSK